MMTYSEARACVLDVLSDLALDGALNVHGLQLTHRNAADSAGDEYLDERTRTAAAWLRDQAAAELLMVESCYGENA